MEINKCDPLSPFTKNLTCMVGLPYSGKSTKAKTYGLPIVCPDAIRMALHGKRFVAEAEPHVWAIAKTMVRALFMAGHNHVILDTTNTTKTRRDEWLSAEWHTNFDVVDTIPEICRERAFAAGDELIVPIIVHMAENWDYDAKEESDVGEI